MAEPTTAPPKGKKGGLFGNLSPKQKRYAAVIGGGVLLALVYILLRSRGETEGQTPSDAMTATESAVPASVGGAGESGSAFTGAESEELSERLGEVGSGLTAVNEGLGEIGGGIEQLGEGQSALGSSMAEDFSSTNTSIEEGQARTAAAISGNNRHLAQISKQLKNKANKQKQNAGKAGSKHTATKKQSKAKGGANKHNAPKKNPPKKNRPKHNPPRNSNRRRKR